MNSKWRRLKTGLVLVGIAGVASIAFMAKVTFEFPVSAQAQKQYWTEKSASERTKTGSFDAVGMNKHFVDLAANLSPTVVNIYTKTRVRRNQPGPGGPGGPAQPDDLFRFFFGNPFEMQPQPRDAQSLGSGFVIGADGLVITNSHVVRPGGRNADSVMLKFIGEPANSPGHEATILGVDEGTDVAVLRLKERKKDLRPAPLGNSDQVQVGEWVMAIGNPYGHTHSVTKGIVSALGRSLELNRADFIQTDASINPGNSGGPLFNLYGEVIGINTAIDARAQGIGFAIPVNVAKNVIRQIIEKGEVTLGWIGVSIQDLTPELSEGLGLKKDTLGVLIQDVFSGEPADKAGMKAYDVVTEVNGRRVTTAREFSVAVGNLPVGSKARVKILRETKTSDLEITVAKRKSAEELARRMGQGGEPEDGAAPSASNKAGLVLSDLSPELRRQLGLDATAQGVVVVGVQGDGAAAMSGIQRGDLITEINRRPVRSVAEANRALNTKSKRLVLRVARGQMNMIVVLDLSDE